MLRVAVNSFMDSVNLVLDVMAELDEDVLETRESELKSQAKDIST